jgi:hypothetical protein
VSAKKHVGKGINNGDVFCCCFCSLPSIYLTLFAISQPFLLRLRDLMINK